MGSVASHGAAPEPSWQEVITVLTEETKLNFLIIDREQRIQYISSTLMGYIKEAEGLLGKPLLDVYPGMNWPVYSLLTGRRCEVDVRKCPFTGKPAGLRIKCIPLREGDGPPAGVVVIIMETSGALSREPIGDLTATAAHEIRNPLTGVKGYLQLLKKRLGEEDGRYLALVLHELDRVNDLTRYLLTMTKGVVGELETGCPCDVIRQAVESCLPRARTQSVDVRLRFPDEPFSLCYDRTRLGQVFINLVHNALDAMPKGGVLNVDCRLSTDRSALEIRVSDTGVGIMPEDLPHIFDPYYTTKPDGTGLGLTLCRTFIEQLGGRITVSSSVGVGTEFCITLPLAR